MLVRQSKNKGRATAKFNLNSPRGLLSRPEHQSITLNQARTPGKSTVRFTFMSQTGTTTERCDIVEPEHSDGTKTTLSLMQSVQKLGKVDLVLHYHNSKSRWRLLETVEDFKNSRPHHRLQYIHNRKRTAATIFPSHRRCEAILNAVLYDNKPYVLANIPRVLAFRDPLEMEVRLSTSAIIE